MDHFGYKEGFLHAEDIDMHHLARDVGTPFYCYSDATLRRHYDVFTAAFEDVPLTTCFAVKCNSNIAVLRTLAQEGAGADTVSEGEIRRALAAGIAADKIVFSGVGKTRTEMRYALTQRIMQFNVESVVEMEALSEVATSMSMQAPVALRVNPDVIAGTHDNISTGRKGDKFGIDRDEIVAAYERARELPGIHIQGLTTHIGSQLTSLTPFREAFTHVRELVEQLRANGHDITRLDLGGGLGIPYNTDETHPPHPQDYAQMVRETVHDLGCELILEPGRLIAGNAGIFVTSVIYIKRTATRNFAIIDGAMNDFIRPALYQAHHDVVPLVVPSPDAVMEEYDIVGPVCETTDILARERVLPSLKEGDLLAFRSAGAYSAVMSSTYNSRPLVAEVMVKGAQHHTIRPRQTYEQLLALDSTPGWLA